MSMSLSTLISTVLTTLCPICMEMYGNIRGEYPESDGRLRKRTAATSAITSAIAATEKQHIARVARVSGVSGTHYERSFALNRLIRTTKGSCLIWRRAAQRFALARLATFTTASSNSPSNSLETPGSAFRTSSSMPPSSSRCSIVGTDVYCCNMACRSRRE